MPSILSWSSRHFPETSVLRIQSHSIPGWLWIQITSQTMLFALEYDPKRRWWDFKVSRWCSSSWSFPQNVFHVLEKNAKKILQSLQISPTLPRGVVKDSSELWGVSAFGRAGVSTSRVRETQAPGDVFCTSRDGDGYLSIPKRNTITIDCSIFWGEEYPEIIYLFISIYRSIYLPIFIYIYLYIYLGVFNQGFHGYPWPHSQAGRRWGSAGTTGRMAR